jgi:streptomycin 6-kinase
MSAFQSNIISIYGEQGKVWLNELPQLVAAISSRLGLSDLKEVANLTYNYVLSGFQGDNPIILKLGLDDQSLRREAFALKCFDGYDTVKVLFEYDEILLLERIIPGTSLKSYFQDKEQKSIEIACGVMKKIHKASIPKDHNFPHIKDWLAVLDSDLKIPAKTLQKTRELRDQLLKTAASDVLLHGDLHHDNILQNGDDWAVIDPKGVIGEPAYEVAAFIRNPMPELLSVQKTEEIIQNRIVVFSNLLELSTQRILDWSFVQAVLSWIWAIENSCDTSSFAQLTKIFDKINTN